jgi:hypothetical protein
MIGGRISASFCPQASFSVTSLGEYRDVMVAFLAHSLVQKYIQQEAPSLHFLLEVPARY